VTTIFFDVLEDFHVMDVAELWMIDDHMLMTDFIVISTKSYYYVYKVGVHFYHTPLHHKP